MGELFDTVAEIQDKRDPIYPISHLERQLDKVSVEEYDISCSRLHGVRLKMKLETFVNQLNEDIDY